MAAVGHLLSPLLHTMFVASSRWIASVRPSGSHPDIDLRWSSERIEFVHHGFEASRSDKVRRIAASDAALRTLRVCWRNPEGTFNCGRCEKCLRTMFALSCFGALERATTFPGRIDPELIARIPLKPGEAPFWVDNLGLAGEPAADPALIEAARRLMEDHRFKYSRIGRLEEAVRDAGNRLGLTTGRLKQWDERYFKSTLSDAFRAVKRRVGGQGLR
jgi:hypothetical protein